MNARNVTSGLTAVVVMALLAWPLTCNAQVLRFATYNLLDNPTNSTDDQNLQAVLSVVGETEIFGVSRPLDLLGFQEGPNGTANYNFVENAFETVFGGNYTFLLATADPSGDRTGVIYNVDTLQLLDSISINDGLTHNTIRAHFRPVGGSTADEFYVYSTHLKAGITGSDVSQREDEAIILRNDADSLPAGSNIILMGDMNMRGNNEGGWVEFLAAGGNGQMFDSINTPFNLRPMSSWNNSVAMQNFHSQNPNSDMDDRFDAQVFNASCFDGSDFEFVKGSLRTVGNNGTHNLGSGISTSNLPSSVTNAINAFSDHLPVVAEFEFGVSPTSYNNSFDVLAFDNETVRPSGPRTGAAGTDEFFIEGNDNGSSGQFASFGVLDFDLSGVLAAGQSAGEIGDISLKLFQANAGFTTNGPFSLYLASPAATDVTIDSTIQYQAGNNQLDSVPSVLATGAEYLGTYAHFGRNISGSTFPDNTLDQIGLNGITLKQAVADSLNGLGNVRLLLSPEQGSTAATFAGFGDNTIDGPMLTAEFETAIPSETLAPSSFAVVRGALVGGSNTDLGAADDSYLAFNPGFTLNSSEPPVWLNFSSQTQINAPSSMDVLFETGANTPGIFQIIEVFNFNAGVWEELDARPVQTVDSIVNLSLTGALTRLVSGSGEVRLSANWRRVGFTILFPWEARIDHVQWSIEP